MRYSKISAYLLYMLLLLGSLVAASWAVFMIRVWIGRNFTPIPGFAGYSLICILLGLLLGKEHFVTEYRKQGNWSVNFVRLIIMGIPFGIFAFYFVIIYTIPIGVFPSYLANSTLFFEFSGLIFGYTLVTSFYKKQQKIQTDEDDKAIQ